MSIEEELRQVIDANLSAEVGARLKTILEEGTQAVADLEILREDYDTVEKEYKRLRALETKAALVAKQKETFDEMQSEINTQRRIFDAVVTEHDRVKDQIYQLARIVFDNPKLKFDLKATGTTSNGGYMNIDGEGGEKTERISDR